MEREISEKEIIILGSTGSIGRQTLEVARNFNIKVCGLSANTNIELLEEQAREFGPKAVAVADEEKAAKLRISLKDTGIEVLAGMEGQRRLVSMHEGDTVVTAMVGIAGLVPTLEAIKNGKNIALANKETLVTAGKIVMDAAAKSGVSIIPVDSEHSAIFQCLEGNNKSAVKINEDATASNASDNKSKIKNNGSGKSNKNGAVCNSPVKRLLLTASGGPFRGRRADELKSVAREEALKHPNWCMGNKITIDSATLMNKGLEVIEARWLFDIEEDRIQVLVHPQSIIHSMVEYVDGSIIAQLGSPDMRIPIQYAITYPERKGNSFTRIDLLKIGSLTFEEPDLKTFRCLSLAYDALKDGGTMPVVLNAANEVAVELFLQDRIAFLDIPELIGEAMGRHTIIENPSLEDILETDMDARRQVMKLVGNNGWK